MTSLRGKLAISVIKKFMNMNPFSEKDAITVMRKTEINTKFKVPKNYRFERFDLDGLPVEVFEPLSGNCENVIYYLHGGGYITHLTSMYRNTYRHLSKAGHGARIVMIDYRCAPEYKYPCALEDALKGWDWLMSQGYKPENIIVGGDSAGGNLTLVLMLKLRELGKKLPKALVLLSPWTDMTASGETYISNFKTDPMFGCNRDARREQVEDFLNSSMYSFCLDEDRQNPLISPIFGEYHGFPPSLFVVGGSEMLYNDTTTIVDKLKAEGIDVELYVGEGMFHVFPLFFSIIPESKVGFNVILDYISKSFASDQKS